MKNLSTCILFALSFIFISCEKQDITRETPIGNSLKPKSIDWTFTSVSALSDTGYYSIQPYYGPGIWQYTRITKMDVTGIVIIDSKPVKFSGNFYIRQAAGNKPSSEGYFRFCEARDDNTNHCLEFLIINKTPEPDIKLLSDLKKSQTFSLALRVDNHSGRYDAPENNSRELELKLIAEPGVSSYTLNLTGGLVY